MTMLIETDAPAEAAAPTAWYTVAEAKVTYAPLPVAPRDEADPEAETEEKVRFVRMGITVMMENGDRWFYSYRTGGWSRRWQLDPEGEEHKDSFTRKEMTAKPWCLLEALLDGKAMAEAE